MNRVEFRITDQAGNQRIQASEFKADIYPIVATANLKRTGKWSPDLTFSNRTNLYGKVDQTLLTYTYENKSDFDQYVKPKNMGTHSVALDVEQAKREHNIRLTKKTSSKKVPKGTFIARSSLYTPHNGIYDESCGDYHNFSSNVVKDFGFLGMSSYNTCVPGGEWGNTNTGFVADGGWYGINSDSYPASPATIDWRVISRNGIIFDQNNSYNSSYDRYPHNYSIPDTLNILDPDPTLPTEDDGSDNYPRNEYYEKVEYGYESQQGYPKNVSSTFDSDEQNFSSTFTVKDINNNNVQSVSGWYKVPKGMKVTVRKVATTPVLSSYNDTAVGNLSTFRSYTTKYYDKHIVWSFAAGLELDVLHDAGAANVSLMSPKTLTLDSGVTTKVTLSR